jgi:carboxypeptidase Q
LQRATPCLVLLGLPASLLATEPVDLDMMTRIRDEGFNRSQVMETAEQLTDVIGPRLTGSPGQRRASEWTRKRLEEWGLEGPRLEAWGEFGRGWSFTRAAVNLVGPEKVPLIALPKAWTPGTNGPQRGRVLRTKLEAEADLEKWKGQVRGAVLLLAEARDLKPRSKKVLRYSEADLEDLEQFEVPRKPAERERERDEARKRRQFTRLLNQWLMDEGALATVEPSSRDGGTLRVMGGGSRRPGDPVGTTALVMAGVHYNRLLRLVEGKVEPELEVDVDSTFHDEDTTAANTLAELPGSGARGEVVMVGAHLDSWHTGTGATDNAAGVAVAMEAVRILKAVGARPRRTIRVALWTGEEQGLLGSRAYVGRHFASRPEPDPAEADMPSSLRQEKGPLTLKPAHGQLSAYFNLDNGTGKIRGVYLQENAVVAPIFEAWLKPFADLDAETLTMRKTGSTDHVAFDQAGLPGFQFIQDEVDYRSTPDLELFGTHHTNMDTYDRLQREDLMQASVIMAAFVWNAASREALLPRRPLPPTP